MVSFQPLLWHGSYLHPCQSEAGRSTDACSWRQRFLKCSQRQHNPSNRIGRQESDCCRSWSWHQRSILSCSRPTRQLLGGRTHKQYGEGHHHRHQWQWRVHLWILRPQLFSRDHREDDPKENHRGFCFSYLRLWCRFRWTPPQTCGFRQAFSLSSSLFRL